MSGDSTFYIDSDAKRYGTHMHDVFICYCGEDVAEAERIAARLEHSEGWICWYAERNTPPSRHNDTEFMLNMISKCSVFLLISSANAMNNLNVQVAVSHAMALGRERLVLNSSDDSGYEQAVEALCRQIREILSSKAHNHTDDLDELSVPKGAKIKALLFSAAVLVITVAIGIVLNIANRPEPQHVAVWASKNAANRAHNRTNPHHNIPPEFAAVAALAQQGDIEAKYELGNLFTDIHIYSTAAYWYQQAAEGGHVEANVIMGLLYRDGWGVRQCFYQGIYWFHQAAILGDVELQRVMASLYRRGDPFPQDFKRSAYWSRRAAQQGCPVGQSNLAISYSLGQGVPQCFEQAVYWNLQAAAQGSAVAQVNLGWMYEFGRGVEASLERAAYWYHRSASQGDTTGQNNLGIMFLSGRGVGQCYDMAFYWFRQAAEQGCHRGAAYLGHMYEITAMTQEGLVQAVYWFRRAPYGYDWVEMRLNLLLEQLEN